jgi:hypothetical protein
VNRPPVFACVFVHAELALVLRVMRRYAEATDAPLAADVVAMLENALDEPALAAFALAGEEVAP